MSEIARTVFRNNLVAMDPIDTEIDAQLTRLSSIEVVLFDVYGTLFISGSGDIGTATANPKVESLEQSVAAVGVELNEPIELVLNRHYIAIQESHALSKSAGVLFPEVDILKVWAETMQDYDLSPEQLERLAVEYESRTNPVWPMPGLAETLIQIRSERSMGIVSNAQFFTLELFELFLGKERKDLGFDPDLEVFSFAEAQAKPGTEIYQIAVQRLEKKGIGPEQVLYVGNDMLNDIMPAQRMGFRTALFAGDQRSLRLRKDDQRVVGVRPDIIVKQLAQIPQCIE